MGKISNITLEITEPIQDLREAHARSRNMTDKVHSFSYSESLLTGEANLELELIPKNLNGEEALQFSNSFHAFRITIQKDNIECTTGWKLFVCESSSLFFYGSTPVIKIKGNSIAALMKQKVHWRSFLNTPARTIFSSIGATYGLSMQSTEIATTGSWCQCGENDWDFLHRVRKEIVVASGQRNAYLFIENKNMVLLPIDISKVVSKRYGLGSGDDRVENIRYAYNGKAVDILGGSEFVQGSFDVLGKTYNEITPPPSMLPVLAGKNSTAYGSGKAYKFCPLQIAALVQATAFTDWIETTQKHFSFQANLPGEVGLHLGDIIEIQGVDVENQGSSMNGKYPVFEILYQYNSAQKTNENIANFMTTIGGFRRTFHYGNIQTEGTVFSNVVSNDTYSPQNPAQQNLVTITARPL